MSNNSDFSSKNCQKEILNEYDKIEGKEQAKDCDEKSRMMPDILINDKKQTSTTESP